MIDTSVNSFRPIPYSRQDTCPTQRAVAEHNAVYDTLKTGKAVAYRAPCELTKDAPGKPVARAVPDDVRHETEWHRKPAKPITEIDADKARQVAGL